MIALALLEDIANGKREYGERCFPALCVHSVFLCVCLHKALYMMPLLSLHEVRRMHTVRISLCV